MVVNSRPRRARPGQRRRLPLITAMCLLAAALGLGPWSPASAQDRQAEIAGSTAVVTSVADHDDREPAAAPAIADEQAIYAATDTRSVLSAGPKVAVEGPRPAATGPRAPPQPIV